MINIIIALHILYWLFILVCEVRDASGIIQSTNYPESYSSTDEWCVQLNGRVGMLETNATLLVKRHAAEMGRQR